MATIAPNPLSQLLSGVKEALSCGFLSATFATGVYGITVLQAYIYFRNSGKASVHMRLFVAVLFLIDTVSLILMIHACYQYIVTYFGHTLLYLQIPTTLAFENGFNVLTRALTQCFFAHRLWALSKHNVGLVGSIVVLAFCSLGPGIGFTVRLLMNRDIFSLASTEIRILVGIASGLSVLCDITIIIGLCYYLNSRRTGFKRTESMIDRLMIYAVNRGALTAIFQAGEVITTVGFPGHFWFLPFGFIGGRLYCNTLLATLNAQTSMREDDDNVMEVGTRVLKMSSRAYGSHRNAGGSSGSAAGNGSMPTFVIDISGDAKPVDIARQPCGEYHAY